MNYRLQERGYEPIFAVTTEPEISEWFEKTIGLLQQKRKKQESQK